MKQGKYKPNILYEKATNESIHGKNPQFLMNISCWYRRWNKFCTDGIIPDDNDYGIARGAPPIITNTYIALLNDDLVNTIGVAEDDMESSDKIINAKENEMIKKGAFPHWKIPASGTV